MYTSSPADTDRTYYLSFFISTLSFSLVLYTEGRTRTAASQLSWMRATGRCDCIVVKVLLQYYGISSCWCCWYITKLIQRTVSLQSHMAGRVIILVDPSFLVIGTKPGWRNMEHLSLICIDHLLWNILIIMDEGEGGGEKVRGGEWVMYRGKYC